MVPKEPEASDVQTGLLKTVLLVLLAKMSDVLFADIILRKRVRVNMNADMYTTEKFVIGMYEIEPKELSYVVVPSDPYAQNIRVYTKKVLYHPSH